MEIFGALNGAVSAMVFVRERANKLKINQLQIERLIARCQDFIGYLDAMSKMMNLQSLANELESLLVDVELFIAEHGKCQLLQRVFNADGLHRSLKDFNERLTALADSLDCQLFIDADAIRKQDEEDIKYDNELIMAYIKELENRESMLIDALELREEQFVEALFIMERRMKVVKNEAEKQFLLTASSCIYRISNGQQGSKPKWLKPQWEITLKHKLASGGFGDVYIGEWNSCTVAIKVMRKTDNRKDSLNEFVKEVELWYNELNNHPHVLSLYGACHTVENPFMIFEYMDNGHLLQYLNHFSEQNIRALREAALGIRHLHENGVIHGDIKAINILINGEGIAKIADFGFTFVKDSESDIVIGGTLRWLAPELLIRHRPDYPSDVYAFGITIYEVFNKNNLPPYFGESDENIKTMVLNGILPTKLINIELQIWSIIEECLCFDPSNRSSLLEVIDQLTDMPSSNINKPAAHVSNDDFDKQLAQSTAKLKIKGAAAFSTVFEKCDLLFKNGDEGSIVQAIDILYKEACNGNVKAQIKLGEMHCSGKILNYDLEIALAYFKRAAESNLDIAHYSLAYFYFKEQKPKNVEQGFKHLLKAANQGNLAAMTFYGKELQKEQPEQAFKWFQKAANQNYKKAFLNLGLCYLNGTGCMRYIPKAIQALTVSAEQGDNPAAWRILGSVFANLESDPILLQYCDMQRAMRCFKSAINLGYKDAYIELSQLYFQGFTLEMDKSERIAKSKSILLRAIDESVIPAYYLMGTSFENGIHQPVHLETALHFYKLGDQRNCPKCKLALGNLIPIVNNRSSRKRV